MLILPSSPVICLPKNTLDFCKVLISCLEVPILQKCIKSVQIFWTVYQQVKGGTMSQSTKFCQYGKVPLLQDRDE